MQKLDCLGDFCPIPVLKAEKQFKTVKSGDSFMLVTDHSCVVESIEKQFSLKGACVEIFEVMNGIWEIEITKA